MYDIWWSFQQSSLDTTVLKLNKKSKLSKFNAVEHNPPHLEHVALFVDDCCEVRALPSKTSPPKLAAARENCCCSWEPMSWLASRIAKIKISMPKTTIWNPMAFKSSIIYWKTKTNMLMELVRVFTIKAWCLHKRSRRQSHPSSCNSVWTAAQRIPSEDCLGPSGLKSIEMTRNISGKRSDLCGNTTPASRTFHINMGMQDSMKELHWRRQRMRTMSPHALSSPRVEYPEWIQLLSWQKWRSRVIPSRLVR